MISLQPQTNFSVVRQLADHTDITSYYVQAVIRNSITSVVLKTIQLTDKTGGRFMKEYEVPADVSGLGFYIDITISVYTDSGYLTKATVYGDDNEQYLVFDRIKPAMGGGSGGSDVDYKKIGKLVNEAIKSLKMPDSVNLEPILKAVDSVLKEVQAIEMPEMEKIDNTPIISAITQSKKDIVKAIDEKEVTEKTDLTEVLSKIEEKEPNLDDVHEALATFKETFDDFVDKYKQNEGAKDKIEEMRIAFESIRKEVPIRKKVEPVAPVLTPFDRARALTGQE